ncbi:uncharacterized protein BJ171DRAFT_423562, partial [Polychytrium aggregatum]|uniref:uncharacterized protein n=1 Tax=Polychytrium aggregatum TaxID=110093 RepID=UPI0022FF0876
DNTPIYIWRTVPSSSVWCEGSNRAERVCKFRNLCYAPQYERWFIFKTNRTVLHGVPENHHTTALLEMTTVTSHTAIFFNYEEVNPFSPKFRNIPIRYEEDLHFITMRLHPENIMHNLHDDTLGLYFLIKQYVGQGSAALDMPFSLDTHRILVDDGFLATNTEQPLRYLSSRPIRYRNYLDQEPDVITCFRDAVVGNRKLVNWYQYGFTEPQGPIKDKHVNGMHIREISECGNATDSDTTSSALPPVPTSFHPGTLIPGVPENYDPTLDPNMDPISTDIIVILSRRGNRLIVNEDDLAERLHERYGLEVVFVRNEDHGFEEQVAFMRRARVVLGMHGSLLIMGMFCKRGAIMIELFPYGVPSENYTPYRTMAHLPGMLVSYRAWENKHKNNTISHPDRHALFGGIKHLSEEEQREIEESTTIPPHKCCTNPRWLYRIYADTIVEINEVIGLIDDAVKESRLMRFNNYLRNWEEPDMLELPTVETPVCLDGPGRKPGELWARWGNPFSGAKVDRWSVMVEEKQTEYMAIYGPLVAISGFEPGTEVVFWVRPTYPDGRNGEFGNRGKCPV